MLQLTLPRYPVNGEMPEETRSPAPTSSPSTPRLQRTFRLKDRYNLDVRVDSTNLLNHVVFTAWNTTLNPAGPNPALSSPLFGLPAAANAMRSLQTTMRLRF